MTAAAAVTVKQRVCAPQPSRHCLCRCTTVFSKALLCFLGRIPSLARRNGCLARSRENRARL